MSESMVRGRRNTVLAAVIGSVLAGYAGSAVALEFEFDNGAKLNWNTTLSVGANWRAEDPNRNLYSRADGSLIGLYSGTPMIPGQAVPKGDGIAGQQAAVYPWQSPGGWHLLGRTTVQMFDATNPARPALLAPGDKVRFVHA